MSSAVVEIKKNLKSDKLVIGTERTLSSLRKGKLTVIFLTSNCPQDIQEHVEHYSKLSGCSVEHLSIPNDEFGAFCKKPFAISVAGLLK
jgi:large subunit ribosomal protein L30e